MKFSGKASQVLDHMKKTGCTDPRWTKIAELHQNNEHDAANRLFRKIFGLVEPMSEEKKEEMRIYNETHKEEIEERRKQKREVKKRALELINGGKKQKKIKRKR